jgi:hypothetical protein
LPDRVLMGGIEWRVEVALAATDAGFAEARIRVSAPDQPGAVYVVYAPAGPAQ